MRTRRMALSALLALGLITGCSESDAKTKQEQPPEQVVAAVAQALTQGDLRKIEIHSGDPRKDLPEILRGMQGIRPRFTPGEVRRIGRTLNFRLNVSWPLSTEWTYETKATMTLDEQTWKLNWSPTMVHPSLTADNRMEAATGTAARGNIIGQNGIVLVQSEPALVLGINKGAAGARGEDSIHKLAAMTGLDDRQAVDRFRAARPQDVVELTSVRIDSVPKGFNDLPGAQTRPVTLPVAKSPTFARSVIGGVGPASSQVVEQSKGSVFPGEYIGQGGLQQRFDQTLRGKGESKVYLVPRSSGSDSGKAAKGSLLADFPAVAGQNVVTTLDDDMQSNLEDALDGTSAPAAAAVVDVKSGALIAAANNRATREIPVATAAKFTPGTAAMPATYLALLRAGANPDQQVTCDPSVEIQGRVFTNPQDIEQSGPMTLERAAAYGCVTALVRESARLSDASLTDAAAGLGASQDLDLGFPNALGWYPTSSDARVRAGMVTGAEGVQASPLGLATLAASVQNRRTMVPWVVATNRPAPAVQVHQLTPQEAGQLQDMMESALLHGPASDLAGELTGASYGTAEGRTWLVGYNSQVAVAIEVQDTETNATSTLHRAVTAATVRGSR